MSLSNTTLGRPLTLMIAVSVAAILASGVLACSGSDDSAASDGGPPSLTALSVSSATDAAPPLALAPEFSSDVHDYYVRCAAGENAVTVSMTASAGSSSQVTEPTSSPSLTQQTVSLDVKENQAIVATASDGKSTTEYWVRCLPNDFPPLVWSPHAEAGAPPPGYYLVGSLFPTTSAAAAYAMILDSNGVPVWYQRAPQGFGASTVDSPAKNTVAFDPFYPPTPKPFEVRKLSPLDTTEAGPKGYETDEHDLRVLKNGDYLVLSYPYKTGVDLTGLDLPLPNDGGVKPLGPDSMIQDCTIVEFTPAGTVVHTWSASDHFNPVDDSIHPLKSVGPPPPDGGTAYDVYHCNSLDVDPSNGNLLVSAREMDSVFYVEWPSGTVLWKMGGQKANLDKATYVSVPDAFHQQHDARLQPGWSSTCNGGTGQVSVFDDESYEEGPSRGVLYDVAVGGGDAGTQGCENGKAPDAGAAPGTATRVWEYKGTGISAGAGSFRISSDGSRVIGWGLGGDLTKQMNGVFTEADVKGNDLLDFAFGNTGNPSYRAIKMPLTQFDLSVLRNTAGLP
jgi:hypothetical protein